MAPPITPAADAAADPRKEPPLPRGRHRPAPLVASEQGVAHVVEKAALLRRLFLRAFELLDARMSALQGFVLDERGLHQRIGGVRGARQALGDRALPIRIAWRTFQRGETVEQLDDELAFLWRHGRLHKTRGRGPQIMLGAPYLGAMAQG
jgi:hypothetical protein